MTEYTGYFFTVENCAVFNGATVNVLEYRDPDGGRHGTCFRCGRALRRHWYTVQTADNDAVYCDIGAECVKKLK